MARFTLRKDTDARWVSINPTLAQGEPAHAYDTGTFKIGNGIDAWNDLAAAGGGGGIGGSIYDTTVGATLGEYATIDEALDNGFRSILIMEEGTYSNTKHRLFDIDLSANQVELNIHSIFQDRTKVKLDTQGYEWVWTTSFDYTLLGHIFTGNRNVLSNVLDTASVDITTLGAEVGDFLYSGFANIFNVIEKFENVSTIIVKDEFYFSTNTDTDVYFIKGAKPVSIKNLTMYNRSPGVVLGSVDGGWPAFFNSTDLRGGVKYDVSIPVSFENVLFDWDSNAGDQGFTYDNTIIKPVFKNCKFRDLGMEFYSTFGMFYDCVYVDGTTNITYKFFYDCSIIGNTLFAPRTIYSRCTFDANISGWSMPAIGTSLTIVDNCIGVNSSTSHTARSSVYT